jgi:hypothetical protein
VSHNAENHRLPDFLHGLFCTPSLMKGESAEVYAMLYAQVEDVVEPKDVFDQMLVSDITNHFWEQQRIRRCSGIVIDSARRQALVELLTPMVGYSLEDAVSLADIYFGVRNSAMKPGRIPSPELAHRKQPEPTRKDVIAMLEKHGLDECAIDVAATRMSVGWLASFESLILKHEVRRDAILDQIERRREKRSARRGTNTAALANGRNLPQEPSPSLAETPV